MQETLQSFDTPFLEQDVVSDFNSAVSMEDGLCTRRLSHFYIPSIVKNRPHCKLDVLFKLFLSCASSRCRLGTATT